MEAVGEALALLNALLNATSATLAFAGWRVIKRPAAPVPGEALLESARVRLHRRLMLSAVSCSVLFLTSYLLRLALTGTHRFVGPDGVRMAYRVLLASHTTLAVVVVPLVARVLFLAWKGRVAEHSRLARWTLPAWLYVSVTGVLVYVMLYHVSVG